MNCNGCMCEEDKCRRDGCVWCCYCKRQLIILTDQEKLTEREALLVVEKAARDLVESQSGQLDFECSELAGALTALTALRRKGHR